MNVTKRTLAVVALAAAALSTSAVAHADTLDPKPQKSVSYLVYPYQGTYPPGLLPFAAAVPTAALLGVNPFSVV
ncbi:hypothetical protein ACIBU0_19280 [Streptomyces sp. NPDC049627]|uniref:hypothetical protein n=1 Tax=Streptomyces sp. NPDC049627 TaxID=3365595 RepID=UPI003799AA64